MTVREIGTSLDAGGDLDDLVAWTIAEAPSASMRRIQADPAAWIVDGLDKPAARLGLSRDAPIRLWLSERLQ